MSSPVPGTLATRRFAVTVAADAPRSQAYFLRRPLVGALYDWSGVPAAWRGLPFEPPPVQITVRLTIAGQPLTLSREVVYRYRDQGTGEVRRPLFVTRPFDVAVTPDLVVWPVDGTAGGLRHFTITVTNRTRGPAVARIALATPPGWSTLRPDSLSFEREDEAKSLSITLAPPASVRPGEYELKAAALGAGRDRSDGALALIDYPHIRAPARPGDRRDRGGDGSGLREPRVPRPQRNRARRLAWLGAGAGTVFRARLGSRLHAARRDARSRRAAAPGRTARGRGGQGHVRAHRAELFPTTPRWCPRRVSSLRESPRAGQAIKCGRRNSECGVGVGGRAPTRRLP